MESLSSYKDSFTYLIAYSKYPLHLMSVCFHATPCGTDFCYSKSLWLQGTEAHLNELGTRGFILTYYDVKLNLEWYSKLPEFLNSFGILAFLFISPLFFFHWLIPVVNSLWIFLNLISCCLFIVSDLLYLQFKWANHDHKFSASTGMRQITSFLSVMQREIWKVLTYYYGLSFISLGTLWPHCQWLRVNLWRSMWEITKGTIAYQPFLIGARPSWTT